MIFEATPGFPTMDSAGRRSHLWRRLALNPRHRRYKGLLLPQRMTCLMLADSLRQLALSRPFPFSFVFLTPGALYLHDYSTAPAAKTNAC